MTQPAPQTIHRKKDWIIVNRVVQKTADGSQQLNLGYYHNTKVEGLSKTIRNIN